MTITSQSGIFRALLEQASFNSNCIRLLGELMSEAGVEDNTPAAKLIDILSGNNSEFLKKLEAAINLYGDD